MRLVIFPVLLLGLAGCDPSQSPPTASPKPLSSPVVSTPPPDDRFLTPPSPPANVPAPVPTADLQPADEPVPEPSELARKFHAATDPQERGEIVDSLWEIDTVASIETIRQLFLTERDSDVKVDMIAGLTDSPKPETRQSRFGLIAAAVLPNQPKEVREIAMQMLVDFEDPRTLTLLQQYSRDPDPEVSDAAKEALEARKEAAEQ